MYRSSKIIIRSLGCLLILIGMSKVPVFAQDTSPKSGKALFYIESKNSYDTIPNAYYERFDQNGNTVYLKKTRFNKNQTIQFITIEEFDAKGNLIFSARDSFEISYRYDEYGNMTGYSYNFDGQQGDVERQLTLDSRNRPVEAKYLFNGKAFPNQKEVITWKSGIKSVSRMYVNGKLSQIVIEKRKNGKLQYHKTIEFSRLGEAVKNVSVKKFNFKNGEVVSMRQFENKQIVYGYRRFFNDKMKELYRVERYFREEFDLLIIF